MLILLSPSKALDFATPIRSKLPFSQPRFIAETRQLVKRMQRASSADLKRLMDISDAPAELNRARYQNFCDAQERPAILAFNGDVYAGLDAPSLSDPELSMAQDTIRILSGLYGLLRPLDAIRPYRLEMGVRLDTPKGKDLYAFWGTKLAEALDTDLAERRGEAIVNLASDEYFAAVDRKSLRAKVITPVFKEVKAGKARALFMYLKRARGRMARWALRNGLRHVNDLKAFDEDGYRYDETLSDALHWTFTRPQPLPAKSKGRSGVTVGTEKA